MTCPFSEGRKVMPMKIEVGDRVRLRKNHPCGGNTFEVMYAGMDFRIRCLTCGSQMRLERSRLEKRITELVRKEDQNV